MKHHGPEVQNLEHIYTLANFGFMKHFKLNAFLAFSLNVVLSFTVFQDAVLSLHIFCFAVMFSEVLLFFNVVFYTSVPLHRKFSLVMHKLNRYILSTKMQRVLRP